MRPAVDHTALSRLKQRKGVTLGEVARLSGLNRENVRRIFAGQVVPRPSTLARLVSALNDLPDMPGVEFMVFEDKPRGSAA